MIENRRGLTIFSHTMLTLGIAVILFPLYVAFVAATLDNKSVFETPMTLIPGSHLLENMKTIWVNGVGVNSAPFWLMMLNSFIMAFAITVGKIVVSMLSAFAIVWFRFPLRNLFFWMIFITLMLPVEVRIFPTVEVIANLNMLDSYAGLTLPLMASATATFLFRQFFMTLPDELIEAARIDGASPMRFFRDIVLPLSKTNLAALFVITFIYGWNQYLWPLLIIQDVNLGTAVAGIKGMIATGEGTTQWNQVMAAMLLTTLLSARVGISATFTMALIAAGLSAGSSNAYSAEMVHLILTGVVSGIVAVQYLKDKPQRVRMVIAGVIVAVVNMVVILAMSLMTSNNISGMMTNAMWSMAGGILSGLISVGFQPVFEAAFNLATPAKLLELANPNQPLLRRLLLEAPGTYHHAIVVANLAEAAAEKIGANPLLARTGAYFHDIGKLKRPLYFKENQMGDNPHDRTDPYVSAAIVTAHTRDGLALAQKYHLPPEIQTIIMEHHGDTPVMYFYHKALQMADGKPVDIADFRYDGQRPTTKESAIVMLADTIEAAAVH